ncbi:hypothetical protein TWF281_003155 [Arthrobotrys megalospora]
MKSTVLFSIFLLFQFAAATALPRNCKGCNANNCLRAVRGRAVGAADCHSFLVATVTPATSTVTIPSTTSVVAVAATVTSYQTSHTVYSIFGQDSVIFEKRQQTVTASALPPYASHCKGVAAYISACSCIGVFPTTTTAPQPVTTVTSITTVASSVTTTVTSVVPYMETACDPGNDYGYFFDSSTSAIGSNQGYNTLFLDLGPADCCNKCFSTPGCFTYRIQSSQCVIGYFTNNGNGGPSNAFCPGLGSGIVFINTRSPDIKTAGPGPCVIRPLSTQAVRFAS